MTSLVLIDSSAWLFALGPQPAPRIRERVRYLVEQNLAAITSPILFELLSGIRSEQEAGSLKAHLSALHLFPVHPADWIEAAEWTSALRKKGLRIKTVGALIAYEALKHDLILLHADSDMDRIARKSLVRVESCVGLLRHS